MTEIAEEKKDSTKPEEEAPSWSEKADPEVVETTTEPGDTVIREIEMPATNPGESSPKDVEMAPAVTDDGPQEEKGPESQAMVVDEEVNTTEVGS